MPLTLDGLWEIASNKDFSFLANPQYLPKTLPPFNENTSVMSAMEKEDILLSILTKASILSKNSSKKPPRIRKSSRSV